MTDVSTELAVMQAVGNALAQLPDNESRVRVLRWAADRVRRSAPPPQDAEPPAPAADPSVSLEGLTEMFPHLAVHIRQDRSREREELGFDAQDLAANAEPLDALIRTLAADLGQFAIAWQHA